MQLPIRLNCSD